MRSPSLLSEADLHQVPAALELLPITHTFFHFIRRFEHPKLRTHNAGLSYTVQFSKTSDMLTIRTNINPALDFPPPSLPRNFLRTLPTH